MAPRGGRRGSALVAAAAVLAAGRRLPLLDQGAAVQPDAVVVERHRAAAGVGRVEELRVLLAVATQAVGVEQPDVGDALLRVVGVALIGELADRGLVL